MSCREQQQLLLAGASELQMRAHASSCKACGSEAAAVEEIVSLAAQLVRPSWSPALAEALLSVPRRAITCATADDWAARSLEGELDPSQSERLNGHRSRCSACAAAAETLSTIADLTRPQLPPWTEGRVAAALRAQSGQRRPPKRLAWLRGPRAAIAFAYAAALVLMLTGLNPADLARKAVPAGLQQDAKATVVEVRASAVDRIGAWEDRALRTVSIWRGRAGGYSRAALSRAIQLVMKTEPAPSPSRPRSGEERGAMPRDETAITTWRA